jgi:hypothetical protein
VRAGSETMGTPTLLPIGMCVCVCMCMCMCMCVYVCIYVCVCVYIGMASVLCTMYYTPIKPTSSMLLTPIKPTISPTLLPIAMSEDIETIYYILIY